MTTIYRSRLLCLACVLAVVYVLAGCGSKGSVGKSAEQNPVSDSTKTAKAARRAESKPDKLQVAKPQGKTGGKAVQSSDPLPPELEAVLRPAAKGLAANPPAMSGLAPGGTIVAPGKPVPNPSIAFGPKPDGKRLLAALQNVYRSTGSIRMEGIASTVVTQNGKVVGQQKGERFLIIFKRPNKFFLKSPQSEMTCDGKTVYNYVPAAKRYGKMPFGRDLLMSMINGRPGVGNVGLIFGADYTAGISSFKMLKDAKVGGRDTYVLSLKLKSPAGSPMSMNMTQTLWIGKQDLCLCKNDVVIKARPKVPAGSKEGVPASMESRQVTTLTSFAPNVNVPDSTFNFKKPAGAKFVEAPKRVNVVGKAAPDFEFVAPDGGKKKLSDFQGKRVILIFWGLPMQEGQLPAMQQLYDHHKDDCEVIAINLNRDATKVKEDIEKQKISMPVIYANETIARVVQQQYGMQAIPTVFIIDKKGVVQDGGVGVPAEKILGSMLKKAE